MLNENQSYFISATSVDLMSAPRKSAKKKKQVLYGDWLRYLGSRKGEWIKIHVRGEDGWIREKDITENRLLEINFLDVGQGDGCHIVTPDDEIILIDAGVSDNMFRFLNWRYNLRERDVVGVDGVEEGDEGALEPFDIQTVVITHPDKDHYYGFRQVFDCKKLRINKIYHNGIVERPIKSEDKDDDLKYYSKDSLGGYVTTDDDYTYLWDVVTTNAQLRELIDKHWGTRKLYLQTLQKAVENNPDVKFRSLSESDDYLPKYGANAKLNLKLLGPLREEVQNGGKTRKCLYKLGTAGQTKNGHSVILQLNYDKIKVMLGGDLNTEAEDYLLQMYAETDVTMSDLEKEIHDLELRGDNVSVSEKRALNKARRTRASIIDEARKYFQADVTKACHHGSHHFSEAFLQVLNSVVTVISSGDNESYAHPRPDALGSFGRYGRGIRPLIFSTELARSTREFTPIFRYYEKLKDYESRIAAETDDDKKKQIEKEMQEARDKNVVVYGMITLRTDGEKVVLAQKLETGDGWDIHELHYNDDRKEFVYEPKTH